MFESKTQSVAAIEVSRVAPASAGIQFRSIERHWVPAFAGTANALLRHPLP